MNAVGNPIEKILITEEEIKCKVFELAKEIDLDYKDKEPVFISVLNGSFMFTADLIRAVTIPVGISFIFASSYGSSTISSGNVNIHNVKGFDPAGKDRIIIEDIIDSGRTLSKIKQYLIEQGANIKRAGTRNISSNPKNTEFQNAQELSRDEYLDIQNQFYNANCVAYNGIDLRKGEIQDFFEKSCIFLPESL